MRRAFRRRNLPAIMTVTLLAILLLVLGFHFTSKTDREDATSPQKAIETSEADGTARAAPAKGIGAAEAAPKEVEEGINPGQRAPDFTLRDINGNQVRLSDLRGKPVFLNFFATWCGPCRAEMPDINELSVEFKGKVHVIAVAVDGTTPEIKAFAEKLGLGFTVAVDEEGKVGYSYAIRAIPTSFFIDPDGIITQVEIGMLSKSKMKAAIAKASKS